MKDAAPMGAEGPTAQKRGKSMKKLTIAALLAAQLTAAQPALAAELVTQEAPQMGAFAAARLRVPLGGEREQRRLRAGLTLAPTMHVRDSAGSERLRFGEGLELGITGREPVRLSFGGTPVNQLGQRGTGPDRSEAHTSEP